MVRNKYEKITNLLIEKKFQISTMESCTGGLIASLLTDTEGASAICKGAFVTYCNEAKILQGVSEKTIEMYGVYSKETAGEMAKVCRKIYKSDIGIGVTGTFGNPDLENRDSKPGNVYFGIDFGEELYVYDAVIEGIYSRQEYKMHMAELIADEVLKLIENL